LDSEHVFTVIMAPSAISVSEDASIPVRVKPTVPNGHEVEKKQKTPLQMIAQGVELPGIPTHVSFAAHRQWMLEHMAIAFRVFARKGYTEGMSGHISVRDPENVHTFCKAILTPKTRAVLTTIEGPILSVAISAF
jgi:hypothetical protein